MENESSSLPGIFSPNAPSPVLESTPTVPDRLPFPDGYKDNSREELDCYISDGNTGATREVV